MAKRRTSVRKRDREIEKRQREIRKSKKAAEKRERRLNREQEGSSPPPEGADVVIIPDEIGQPESTDAQESGITEERASC